MKRVCHILLMFLVLDGVSSELYTALVDLEELLDTEGVLIEILQDYIRAEEQKVDLLKRFAQIYRDQHNQASEDVQTYVSNPINAYLLVKRLAADWKQVEALMATDMSHVSPRYWDRTSSVYH